MNACTKFGKRLVMTVERLSTPALISLFVLVLQNSTLVVMTRYSRLNISPDKRYRTSTLVLNQEILKMLLCLIIFALEGLSNTNVPGKAGISAPDVDPLSFFQRLRHVILKEETLVISVPAALFTLQNYLLFVALSYLDVMTFQVWSQTKLFSAAIFSVLMLRRRLTAMQWASLVLLAFGVLLTQHDDWGSNTEWIPQNYKNRLLGIFACVLSGISSSYASVYFERVVKTTAPSLAVRNIHLSLFAIPFAALSMLILDVIPMWYNSTGEDFHFHFWQGYDHGLTIALVVVHALGGLLVAAVMKYADNILKGFATGVAVIISGVMSFMIWESTPSMMFVWGCVFIVAAGIVYHKFDASNQSRFLAGPLFLR